MFKTYAGVQAGSGTGRPAAVSSPGGSRPGPGGWEPSVLYMLGLVIAEVIAVGFLSRHLLK